MLNWLAKIFDRKPSPIQRVRARKWQRKSRSAPYRLRCEVLEDRTAPALVTIHGVTFNSMSSTEDVAALRSLAHPLPTVPTFTLAATSLTAPVGIATEFATLTTANSQPSTIVLGPDGNYWVTETSGNKIARVTPSGGVTEFQVPTTVPPVPQMNPTGSSFPIVLANGPDGNIWFTELFGGKIGRITRTGVITEFSLPGPNHQPGAITAGPDGAMWFSDRGTNSIGRITVTGSVSLFPIPSTVPPTPDNPQGTADPRFIKVGSDGNLWFTELLANKIGRINPRTHVITEFQVPTTVPASFTPLLTGVPPAAASNPLGSSEPRGIVLGPDGNMWFTEYLGDKIARITPAGIITEFQIPTPGTHPFGIKASNDGNIWFSENTSGLIGVMNTSGQFLGQIALPTPNSGPISVENGIGNTMVVVESAGNKIAQITLGTAPQTTLTTATIVGQTSPNATVKLLSFGAPTTSNNNGQFQIAGVPLSPGVNNLAVRVTSSTGFQITNSQSITQIVPKPPILSADLDNDLSSGMPTGNTNDGAVSGEISSNSAVPGVSNGIVSFLAGFDNTPVSSFVNVVNTLNIDGSFNFDQNEINLIAGGTLAAGAHTLHLQATDIYGRTGTFALSFTLQSTPLAAPTLALATSAQTVSLGVTSEFPVIPTPNSEPSTIVLGPDGNYWFAETSGNKIARMTPAGVITEFQIPTTVHPIPFVDPNGSSRPIAIAVGPDGNIWFTELSGGKIGRITPQGTITEFILPGPNSQPGGITAGPDGAMWFVDRGDPNCIGRITVTGVITEFPLPTTVPATPDNPQGTADPRFIKVGSDGNLWFTELLGNNIGRITPAGVITEFPIPTTVPPAFGPTLVGTPPAALSNPIGSSEPRGMVLGPDGNIWFTEYLGDKIGRITPAGVLTEFQIPTPGVHPFGITVGPNGDIYFAENTTGLIGVMNTNGTFLGQLALPTPNSGPFNVEQGIGNTLVVVEDAGNKIAQITLGPSQQTTLSSVTLVGQTTPNVSVKLLNTGATTTSNGSGQYQFTSVPLSLGANIFSVQATDGVNVSTGSETITRIAATPPLITADLVSDLSSGLATGVTTDPAVSGQISSTSAVTGVSNGIVSFQAGFDSTPANAFVDITSTLNVDGSFHLNDAVINQIAKGTLAKGVHVLRLQAKDIFGNTQTFSLLFTLQ